MGLSGHRVDDLLLQSQANHPCRRQPQPPPRRLQLVEVRVIVTLAMPEPHASTVECHRRDDDRVDERRSDPFADPFEDPFAESIAHRRRRRLRRLRDTPPLQWQCTAGFSALDP